MTNPSSAASKNSWRHEIGQFEKVVYFPCCEIRVPDDTLAEAIPLWLQSLAPNVSAEAVDEYVAHAELFILDGCDEAINFGTVLGTQIASVAWNSDKELVQPVGDIVNVPEDLHEVVRYDRHAGMLSLLRPLRHVDLMRLLSGNNVPSKQKAIRNLYAQHLSHRKRCILTTRSIGKLGLTGYCSTLSLRPFSDSQIRRFFFKRLDRESAASVMHFLRTNPYTRDVCRMPLTATLLAAIKENDYDLPRSLSDLYATRFRLLLDDWDRARKVPVRNRISATDKMALLARLALRLHLGHKRKFTLSEFARLWQEGVGRWYPDVGAADALSELRVVNSMIEYAGANEYSLGHLSFQEFLAANAIMCNQQQALLVRNYFDKWWRNVLVFYAGLCGDVSLLLEQIQARLGLRPQDELIQRLIKEARFTSPAVADFLRDVGEEEAFEKCEEDNEDDYDDLLQDGDDDERDPTLLGN